MAYSYSYQGHRYNSVESTKIILLAEIVATEGSTTQSTEYVEYTAKRQVLGGLHLAQGTDRQAEQSSSSTLPRFSKNSVSK